MSVMYPSDVSREQFEAIRPILEGVRKKTSPRIVDLYSIFCGVLYILKSGCQWRMLPKDYPKWEICYYYFRIWSEKKDASTPSVFEDILKKIGYKATYSRWSGSKNEFYFD